MSTNDDLNIIDMSSIELRKENFQPLKCGRNVKQLKKILENTNDTCIETNRQLNKKLEQIRLNYELKINNITSNHPDPIAPYLDYLHWLKHSYLQHNKKSYMIPLLEKITSKFSSYIQYKSSQRLLKVWLYYCDLIEKPLESLDYMYHNDIGTNWSLYYEAKSIYYQQIGQYSKADDILQLGINRKAKPIYKLKAALRVLQSTIAKNIQDKVNNKTLSSFTTTTTINSNKKRSALGNINQFRRKIYINPQKRGLSTLRRNNVTTTTSHNNVESKTNSGFNIFCDTDKKKTR